MTATTTAAIRATKEDLENVHDELFRAVMAGAHEAAEYFYSFDQEHLSPETCENYALQQGVAVLVHRIRKLEQEKGAVE